MSSFIILFVLFVVFFCKAYQEIHSEVHHQSSARVSWTEKNVISTLKKLLKRGAEFHHTDKNGNDVYEIISI